MSDLDKWWCWVEAVSDTSKSRIANKQCYMKGHDIVLMVRDQDARYSDISDEETLRDFLVVNWCHSVSPVETEWRGEEGTYE